MGNWRRTRSSCRNASSVKSIEPLDHVRPALDRNFGGCALEFDQIDRRAVNDRIQIRERQQFSFTDELGHRSRPRFRGATPQTLDIAQSGRSARFDKDDKTKTPDGQRGDLLGLHRAADEAGGFDGHGQSLGRDPSRAIVAGPAPFAQGISECVALIDMAFPVGVAAIVGRRAIITDELGDLIAARPCLLGWQPLFGPSILGLDLPFLGALGLDRPVLLAPQSM